MKKLKMGIVGLGRLGKVHADNIMNNIRNTTLVAACANTKKSLAFAKDELGVPYVYDDFDKMLECEDMEAIVICSPTGCHKEHILKALKKGLHVWTEKPLSEDLKACVEIKALIKKCPKQKFMIGFMRRFDPSYIYAKEQIDKGLIGKPYLMKCASMDPECEIKGTIKYAGHSAGIFMDLGVHDIDLMKWFLGSEVKEVYAFGNSYKYKELEKKGDTEAAVATFKFKNGSMGFMHVGRAASHGYHSETEIVGTDGSIRISAVPQKNNAIIYNKNGVVTDCMKSFPERFKEAYKYEIELFADSVLKNNKMPTTVDDGIYATKVALATITSMRTGKAVKL